MAPQHVRIVLRALQLLFSILAFIFISTSFKSLSDELGTTLSVSLGSWTTTLTQIVTSFTAVYSLWYILAVEIIQFAPRPALQTDRIIDILFVVVLFVAGLTLVTSDYIKDCDMYDPNIRCGNLKAGVVFTFITMAAFLVTFGINFLGGSTTTMSVTTATTEYVSVATPYQERSDPNEALSPIGASKAPGANV